MSRLPSTATLFPYTTLFRSHLAQLEPVEDVLRFQGDGLLEVLLRVLPVALETAEQDRKSTRLNSSHITISYAVFCLKKKSCSTSTKTCAARAPHGPPHHSLT